MKLTILLLTVSIVSVHATGVAQDVTLEGKNITYKAVFAAIKKQTGYLVFGNQEIVESKKTLSLDVKKMPLQKLLDLLLENQPFRYEIKNKTVFLIKKEVASKPETFPINIRAIAGPIAGVVFGPNNIQLAGVTISVKGTNIATTSDASGNFIIEATEGDVLVFSSVGYITKEIKVNNNQSYSMMLVTLDINQSNLDEVVVTKGYYSSSKKMNTGNVSVLKAIEIAKQPVGNPLASLHGRIAGLAISQHSGLPGKDMEISIRGRNSIANGNAPLYVIDGVPFSPKTMINGSYLSQSISTGPSSPLNSINPADIAEITVLKDADATAIYGSMGANGVILITTKKGQKGRTRVDVDYYTGVGGVTRTMEMLNTEQYLEIRREAYANSNMQPWPWDYDIDGTWATNRYTDWQELIIGNTARSNNGQIRFSGGSEQTQFTLGAGLQKETTVYPGNFYDKKISIQSGIAHASSNKKFAVNFNFNYSNNKNKMPITDLMIYTKLPPNAPEIYNTDGSLNWENDTWQNPYAQLLRDNISVTNNYLANGSLSYEIIPNLVLKSNFGFNQIGLIQDVLRPLSSFSPSQQYISTNRLHNQLNNQLSTWIVEPQLSYNYSLGSGKLESLVGITFRESNQKILGIEASDFSTDELIWNLQAATNQRVGFFDQSQYRYNAIYARIGYNWKERYIINTTGRRDGSSRFGPGRQFGNFGAIGAAWIISGESFMRSIPVVSFAKLRGSLGITGNDQLQDYRYLSTYNVQNYVYLNNSGLVPSRHYNPDFGWEEVRKLEAAVEIGLFNNQVYLSGSWYRNRTGNQLVGYTLPNITGFNTVLANLPATVENRGLELEANVSLSKNTGFQYTLSANLTLPRNRLLSYPDFETSNYRNQYKMGQSIFGRYRYVFTGVNPADGLFTFQDLNNDGSITSADDRKYFVTESKYFGGLTNSFKWDNFDLSFHIQFVQQTRDLYYGARPGAFQENGPQIWLDRWQKPGDADKLFQKALVNTGSSMDYFESGSDALLVDASFVRLKNLSLGWNFPGRVLKRMKMQQCRLFIQCQNLLTISKYGSLDPETLSGLYVPTVRMMTTGINLSL